MSAYLLSLFAAIFTGNCESWLQDSAVLTARCAYAQSGSDVFQLARVNHQVEEKNTQKREETQLVFEQNDALLSEVFFTLGEKYEVSFFKFVFVQVLEQNVELPGFERASSVKLPNQPTLVALKIILQV